VGGVPKLRLTAFLNFSTDDFSIDVQERWRSSLNWDSNPALVYSMPDIPSVAYTDVTVTFNIGRDRDKQVFVSAQNLFDKQSPVYLIPGQAATPNFQYPVSTGDDVLGQYFTAGVRLRF
jgi:iron complex outermembrane receptor protein